MQSQCDMLIAVDLIDGASKSEAMIISKCYSEKHLEAGSIDNIEDRGAYWVIVGNLGGLVAKPFSFEIEKGSGSIRSTIGPSYKSPLDMIPNPNRTVRVSSISPP